MSIWNQPQLKPLEPGEESRHQPLDSPPPIHESAPAAVGLCDPMGTTARELRCPRCATSTTETRCQQCDLDLVTGNDPHQPGQADEAKPAQAGVVTTFLVYLRASWLTMVVLGVLAWQALDFDLPAFSQTKFVIFSMPSKVLVSFLLIVATIGHARCVSENATADLSSASGPFDLMSLPMTILRAAQVFCFLSLGCLGVSQTLTSFWLTPLGIGGALVILTCMPMVAALLTLGERVGSLPSCLRSLANQKARRSDMLATVLASGGGLVVFLMIWVVPGPGLLRGPTATLAAAFAGVAIGFLARALQRLRLDAPSPSQDPATPAPRPLP